jgi:hypothetical protein
MNAVAEQRRSLEARIDHLRVEAEATRLKSSAAIDAWSAMASRGFERIDTNSLVDFAQHVEHEQGLTAEESIYQACIMRFRPILMTTMAALLGGVPMMLGTGVGSEIRQPLGYAIVGGLALSQLLTLYTTPVVYIYLDRLQSWLFGQKKQATPGHAQPAPAE